jgi:tRNA pseudouridine55 synthase
MLLEGFLNMLKPPGMTSHDVVAWARAQLGIKGVGHLGTLDPAAAGVLPLSLGRATRLFEHASGPEKAYRAEIVFGLQTDTLDAEGKVIASAEADNLTEQQVRSLLLPLIGEIEQVPPAFSAVSVQGRRLHESARAGIRVAGRPRRVTIHQLDLVDFVPGRRACALVDVVCSGGTYIRALADDLGRAAGCGACLGFLVRTRAGRFKLSESRTLEEVSACVAASRVDECVIPIDWPLAGLAEFALTDAEARAFVRGTAIPVSAQPAARARAYGPGRTFLGLGEVLLGGAFQPRLVLRSEGELTI